MLSGYELIVTGKQLNKSIKWSARALQVCNQRAVMKWNESEVTAFPTDRPIRYLTLNVTCLICQIHKDKKKERKQTLQQ